MAKRDSSRSSRISNPGLISAAKYAEVLNKAVENGLELIAARMLLHNFAMNTVSFDNRQAIETARLWPLVRSHGFSFADRACLALAILRSVPVLTGDREMAQVKDFVSVRLFR